MVWAGFGSLLLPAGADPSPPRCFSWDTLLVLPNAMIKLYENSKISASSLMQSIIFAGMKEKRIMLIKTVQILVPSFTA